MNFVFSMFNEIYELDFTTNTSHAIKSEFTLAQHSEVINLEDNYNSWADRFVVEEDRRKFKRFVSKEHVKDLHGDISVCKYSIRNRNNKIERIRAILIPNGEGKYLCCCEMVPLE